MALITTTVDGQTYVQVEDLKALLRSARSTIAMSALAGALDESQALTACNSYQAVEKVLDTCLTK